MKNPSKKYLRLKCHFVLCPELVLTAHLRSTFETAWEREHFFDELMIHHSLTDILFAINLDGGSDLLSKIKREFPFESALQKISQRHNMKFDLSSWYNMKVYFSYDIVKKTRRDECITKNVLSSHLLPYYIMNVLGDHMITFFESGNNTCEKLLNFR